MTYQSKPRDDDSFLFTLPLYTYLIEPGPRPGFLRDPGKGIVFAPIWTDLDLFERYLEQSNLAGKVSGLQIHTREELVTFLASITPQIEYIAVDPSHQPKRAFTIFGRQDLLAKLQ